MTPASPLAQHIAAANKETQTLEQCQPNGHRQGRERGVGERQ